MKNKRWKHVEGLERYLVSDCGDVWDTQRQIEVAKQLSGIPEYYYVNLANANKRVFLRVHRLVAIAFVGGRSKSKNIVDHIDQDKFNNHYTNLRWTDAKGNNRNKENNLYVGEVYLKDYVEKYENPLNAYSYISVKISSGLSGFDAVGEYDIKLKYGKRRYKVMWEGEEIFLLDLCKQHNKDYSCVLKRIKGGWDVWNSLFNIKPIHPYSLQIPINEGDVHLWYISSDVLAKEIGISRDTLNSRLKSCTNFKSLSEYRSPSNASTYEVGGVTGTISELCKYYNVELQTFKTRRYRYGMTIEDSLLSAKSRVRVVYLNGIKMTTKEMYKSFGLEARKVNNIRSKNGFTIHEVLEYLGVNLSDIDLVY